MAKPPILMRKERGHLVPIDAWAAEQLDALPEGKDLSVRVAQSRSRGKLNLWWAGLGLMVENLPEHQQRMWPTARALHEALLEALGFVHKLWRVDGTFRIQVDSIALDNMEEEEFNEVFERGRALCVAICGYDPFETWVQQAKERGAWR